MNEATPIEDHLLAKYVADEADATERAMVEQWALASAANGQELDRLRSIWDWSGEPTATGMVDTDAAWNRLNERMERAKEEGRVVWMRSPVIVRWIAAAAVLVGLVFAARLWMAPAEQQAFADATFVPVRLADSSSVVLSPGSRIAARMGDQRHVRLHGEAYFEVERDVGRPFVVEAGDVDITVLGTAFTVYAFDTASSVLVRVREGRVQVVGGTDTLVLVAGEHARFKKEKHFMERLAAPPFEVWGERILQFHDAPLLEVLERLQGLYAVRIDLGNANLANCRLTATFENEPIERILDIIAETYGLSIIKASSTSYVINGDGC